VLWSYTRERSEVKPQEICVRAVEVWQKVEVHHWHVHSSRAVRDLGCEKNVRHNLVNHFQH
jgi:hypothetical protein